MWDSGGASPPTPPRGSASSASPQGQSPLEPLLFVGWGGRAPAGPYWGRSGLLPHPTNGIDPKGPRPLVVGPGRQSLPGGFQGGALKAVHIQAIVLRWAGHPCTGLPTVRHAVSQTVVHAARDSSWAFSAGANRSM